MKYLLIISMIMLGGCGSEGAAPISLNIDTIAFMFNPPNTIWECEDQVTSGMISFTIDEDGTGFSGDSVLGSFTWFQTGNNSIQSLSGPFIPVTGVWQNINEIDSTNMSLILTINPGEFVLLWICELMAI